MRCCSYLTLNVMVLSRFRFDLLTYTSSTRSHGLLSRAAGLENIHPSCLRTEGGASAITIFRLSPRGSYAALPPGAQPPCWHNPEGSSGVNSLWRTPGDAHGTNPAERGESKQFQHRLVRGGDDDQGSSPWGGHR